MPSLPSFEKFQPKNTSARSILKHKSEDRLDRDSSRKSVRFEGLPSIN
jgi:hypothetical protein